MESGIKLNAQELESKLQNARFEMDTLADEFIKPWLLGYSARLIMQSLADTEKPLPQDFRLAVDAFIEHNMQMPSWLDFSKIQKGAAFYQKHWFNIQIMLGCYSLPYCYLAGDGVKVLYMSKQLRENTVKRLQLTNDFTLRVINPDNYKNSLVAQSVARVRIFHAANRYHILQSGKWDDSWGAPINQEDMAGTNLAFSFISIRGLRKLGYTVSKEEAESYQHLWNVVGYLMGVNEHFLPETLTEAHTLDAVIAKRQFRPSNEGVELAKALIEGIKVGVPENQRKFIPGFIRFLIGTEYADLLNIKPEGSMQPAISIVMLQHKFSNLFNINYSKKPIPAALSSFEW